MREVDRLEVIREVAGKRLRQGEAGERMRLSVRQVKRLLRRYREFGAVGLISGHRGRKASNAIAPEVRAEVLAVVRERYWDFGPTLAHEKLTEVHGYGVSVETLRKWMAEEGLWRSRKRRGMRVHQSRPRRSALGELVQIDGSPHAWFEDRGPYCTLIVSSSTQQLPPWPADSSLCRPSLYRWPQLGGAVRVAVEQNENRTTVLLLEREPDSPLQPDLLHKLIAWSFDRLSDDDLPGFGFTNETAEQNWERSDFPVSFHDRLDFHARSSFENNSSWRGRSNNSAGVRAFERRSSPAPIRCSCRAPRVASETGPIRVVPFFQVTIRRW